MFIVSRPIRCEMKPQKITDKPQQGSETTSLLFLLQEIFNFPFGSLWKSYFSTTNQHQSLEFGCSETKLPNNPKSDCKLWKFTTLQVGVLGEGFSATKKYGSKTTNHSQLAWPFDLHVKQTPRSIACDWLIFSCSQTRCLAVSDSVFLISLFRKMSFISILCWQQSWNRKRKISVFENSKNKDSSWKKKRARCFVSSRD